RPEAGRRRFDAVAVAHPTDHLRREAAEQLVGFDHLQLRLAELAPRFRDHPPAELLCHQLHPVADAEHGYPKVVERRIRLRRAGVVDARRAAAEDDAGRAPGGYLSRWRVVRQQLAVDAA